jgi:hypothetical protein
LLEAARELLTGSSHKAAAAAAAGHMQDSSSLQLQQQRFMIDAIMASAAAGIVLLPDVLIELVDPQRSSSSSSRLTPQLQALLLQAVLGCGCWQQQPVAAAASQSAAVQLQQGVERWGLDQGQGSTISRLQIVLPPDVVMQLLQEPLLAAVVSGLQQQQQQPGSSSAAAPVKQEGQQALQMQRQGQQPQQQQRAELTAAMAALVGHPPLRACLLTDMKLLYSKLAAAPPNMLTVLLSGTNRSAFWALPQRLAVQSVLLGVLLVMTPAGQVAVPAAAQRQHEAATVSVTGEDGRQPKQQRLADIAAAAAAGNFCLAVPSLSPAVLAAGSAAVGANLSPTAVPYLLAQLELLAGLRYSLNHAVPWLLLRLLLDEQMVMEFVDSKLEGVAAAAGAVAGELGGAAGSKQSWLAVSSTLPSSYHHVLP